MTDSELLIHAAHAAGIATYDYGGQCFTDRWNPLTDDGDALRLAVKLRLSFVVMDSHIVVHGFARPNLVIHEYSGDPYAATRRAIVLAAAELGRNMK